MAVVVVALGCSSDQRGTAGAGAGGGTVATAGTVTGEWLGVGEGGSSYLKLEQSGTSVTGQACESPGRDCYRIQEGTLVGDQLTFFYEWDEDGTTYRVTADLTLSADGQTLSGTLDSTKAPGERAFTFAKQTD